MDERQGVNNVDSFMEALLSEYSVEFHHDLFEQGMTSISIMQLLMRVRKQFGVDIDLDDFLRRPTINHLNHLIVNQIGANKVDVVEIVGSQWTDTVQQLVTLIEGKALQPNQDFFEQGLSSLNVMQLVLAVKKRFGVDIELDTLLAKPTLDTLATLIDRQRQTGEPNAPLVMQTQPAAQPPASNELSVLSSMAEKQAFKRQGLNIRHLASNDDTIRAKAGLPEQFQREYNARRTVRAFDEAPLQKEKMLEWLSALNAMLIEGEYRYLYPSAGGTYSVQTYVEIKPGKVEGCCAGFYYYNPQAHKLDKISSVELSGNSHFYYNRSYYEHAHCCLYFVVEYAGIAPLYKDKSDFFTAIEIGAIVQLLAQKQAHYQIGSCPLSGVDESALAAVLALQNSQRTLMGMAFGRVDAIQPWEPEREDQAPLEQDMAIIGVQGKYPGASDFQSFWQNLEQQKCCFSHVPDNRWGESEGAEHWGGFVDAITHFDPDFFGITEPEREQISAQEACFLTSVYELLDSAGYNGENLQRLGQRVGVFTGVMWNDPIGSSEQAEPDMASEGRSLFSSIANRASWFFNWIGPSIAVDTSCSSSLTSIYLACQAIAQGDCDVAVAGGINLFAHASHFTNLKRFNLISDRADAPAFAESAAGIIPGEGVGVVLVKSLSQAQADGDHIWAVIKGGSLAHSGRVSGYGVPSPQQQSELIASTLRKAGCQPDAVDYIEAAAAGAVFGDASEILAIQKAFAERRAPLLVGTLKPNIGHLESASGISQLTKVLLQMKHGRLLPVMPYSTLNPLINLEDSPIHIISEPHQWQGTRQAPKLAMVNSFGSTGAYANLLIQSYHPLVTSSESTGAMLPEVFVLSAKSVADLRRYAERWVGFIESENPHHHLALRSMFAVTQCGREHFHERLAIPVTSWPALQAKLQQWLDLGAGNGIYQGSVRYSEAEESSSPVLAVTQSHEIAAAWANGQWQDWHSFHQGEALPKVPLPGYPFGTPSRNVALKSPRSGGLALPVDLTREPVVSSLPDIDHTADSIKHRLSVVISQLLQRPLMPAEQHMSLFALGITSSQMVKLASRVEQDTGMPLPMSTLLEKNSLMGLLEYLMEHHDQIKSVAPGSVPFPVVTQAEPPASTVAAEPRPTKYPLSEGQKGLWVVHTHAPQNSAYNCPACLRVKGRVDPLLLQKALDLLVRQYPILASVIVEDEGVPYLSTHPQRSLTVGVETWGVSSAQELAAYLSDKVEQPFDFGNELLFRANLLHLPDDETIILLCAHHIIVDAPSINPMISALLTFYHQLAGAQLPVGEGQDKWYDFVVREQALLHSDEGQRRLEYWVDRLADAPASSKLLADNASVNAEKYQGATYSRQLAAPICAQLAAFSAAHCVYPSSVFLSVFQLVIQRFTGQEDLVIGMPVDARTENGQNDQIGYYVYPIPVRSLLDQNSAYLSHLKTLQQTILDGLAHALPFPVVTRALNLAQSMDDAPLFQMAFVYQNTMPQPAWEDVAPATGALAGIEHLAQYSQKGEYEFMLEVVEKHDVFTLKIKYNPTLYHLSTVLRVFEHLERLLQAVMEQPQGKLIDFPMMDKKESVQLIEEWNRTAVNYGEASCIHTLFEQQAAKTPDAIAVVFENTTLTYQELNVKANQLAFCLQEIGVSPGSLVGVCLPRSTEMIVSLLGILKAGGAYVPLEPDYPASRIDYIVQDAAMAVVITQQDYQSLFAKFAGKLALLNAGRDPLSAQRVEPRSAGIVPENLCYVLYTSGSTGKPKGCMLSHAAIVNRLRWMQDKYQLNATDKVLQKTPYSFDVSVWEFFWPLMSGATLVFATPEGHKDPNYLIELIEKKQITTCHFVPSMLNAFINTVESGQCGSLTRIFASGEALPYSVLEGVSQKLSVKLHNLYGPTEAAIDVSYWEAEKRQDKKTLIGKPIANTQLYIVDRQMNLLPIGAPGELLIGGAGLANGYLNLPELTSQCFIPNPFSNSPADKVYRTGDLARWLSDGNIEYLGRIDNQVKIRGFRIELGEIEQCLTSVAEVEACAVLLTEDEVRGKSITAYVVLHPNATISVREINAQLKRFLPEFMVPAQLMMLDALPITHNGKLDRKALAALKGVPRATEGFVAPTSALQRQLAEIWQQVLNLPQVGINDHFFDIGGNSLTAITLLSRIKNAFPEYKISLLHFYQAPTIAGVITHFSGAEPENQGVLSLLHSSQQDTQLTLVCVPYAGAAATVYQPLADVLAQRKGGYSVYGLTVPGNAFGSQSEAEINYQMVAELCAREIMERVTGKVAIYGHCVGSYLALEITRRLELKGRKVEFLVAAAAFPLPGIIRYLPVNDRWQHKSDESLWRLLQTWGIPTNEGLDGSVAQFLVSRFRKDARMAYQYEKNRGDWRINTPMINLVSQQDPLTAKYGVKYLKWKRCAHDVNLVVLDKGHHYFIAEYPERVADIIEQL
ncbi:non-ribosomal peptide synthetase [Serratia fonticola]|uniref:non-ribosomal peptide synthetase n=1 Tax=Serratia fonticola TaxID=47917 RepID=UPI002DBBC1D1|nr:non-ribosomal peptide synthetase [Serratia fonticola]MEB7885634.1 amino acid adenylation domain-containing protein [Serratia fonticola]